MHIVKLKALQVFWLSHTDCKQALLTWYKIVKHSSFKSADELKAEFPYVSILNQNRVVFNIKGNTYRLVVKFNFNEGRAFIRFIGTHSEYDKINANTI